MKHIIRFFALLLLFAACKPINPPAEKPVVQQFDYGFVTRYGAFYAEQGLPNNVYMLDIYSPGLRINLEGKMKGSGYNLCLSDVFTLPTDSFLLPGITYKTDSMGTADTFLPGRSYDGNINGAYLLKIEEGKLQTITLLTEGQFTITQSSDTSHIELTFKTEQGKKYEAVFHAPLHYKTNK